MPAETAAFHGLTIDDFAKIKQLGNKQFYTKGDLIFSDGDNADVIYFIETGNVCIFIEKFTEQEEISTLGPGDYFGEMAFFSGYKRSASAVALIDSTLVSVDKTAFLNLFDADPHIADKINQGFLKRNKELSFKEHLTAGNSTAGGKSFQIGIKGDPSLRFSAMSRERYDSVVDRIIADLQPRLYDLLINRSAYEIFIHCNSGEVYIRTVFDPLNGEIHQASKLLNIAYIERHFSTIGYDEKTAMLKQLYGFIGNSANFSHLPDQLREDLQCSFSKWKPIGQHEIANTISRLSKLRRIPDFYLRNFAIGIIRDTIRMQFNCDGTQIVNAQGFQAFLEQNLDDDDESDTSRPERRVKQRRQPQDQNSHPLNLQGQRRSTPGRRQDDWTAFTDQD